MRYKIMIFLLAGLVVSANPIHLMAEEGMWLPDTVKNLPLATMKKMGLELKPEEIYRPEGVGLSDAVVIVDGGTGAFVSPEGLILTNHHVAFDGLVSASTPEANYSQTGFLAKTQSEEIQAKNYTVRITKSFKDVTTEVLSVVKESMSVDERQQAIDAKTRAMAEALQNEKEGIDAAVVEMWNGLHYYLYTYEVLKDVRIVYAPPQSIGNFGGDPDNFEWPRHTGDFTFMRAYVGPDGKPAEYSEKNVPYRPKKFLAISLSGYDEGDFVMVMGYPGATFRYRESFSIDFRQHNLYPPQIETIEEQVRLLQKAGEKNPARAIAYSSQIFGLTNALKNFQGSLQGLRRSDLLERRRAEEAAFEKYLAEHPDWKTRYGDAIPQLADVYRDLLTYEAKQSVLAGLVNASDTLQLLSVAWSRAVDREKPEAERAPNLSDQVIGRIKQRVPESWKDRDVALERANLELFFSKADDLPEAQKISAVEKMFAATSGDGRREAESEFARRLLESTRFQSAEEVLKLFDMNVADMKGMNDPALNFVAELQAELDPLNKRFQQFVATVTKLRPLYIEGMSRWKKTNLYPDANRTLRFTYGQVKGYAPRDAVQYHYQTTLQGALEKDTGKDPFDVPDRLKELAAAKDFGTYTDSRSGRVPIAFISDTDITGGNSGSPIMNGRGELIGVVFDGNYEGLGSDYVFNPSLSRAIAVDIRYVLFVTEKIGQAENVIRELQRRGAATGSK